MNDPRNGTEAKKGKDTEIATLDITTSPAIGIQKMRAVESVLIILPENRVVTGTSAVIETENQTTQTIHNTSNRTIPRRTFHSLMKKSLSESKDLQGIPG